MECLLCQAALEFITLALIQCWEFGGLVINSNSLLDNCLWAYLIYLCLLFLAYLVFHQVNYQKHKRQKFRLFEPRQNLSFLERKPIRNSSYRLSYDKYHDHDIDPRPLYAFNTLSSLLQWLLELILLSCTVLHRSAPRLESSVSTWFLTRITVS